jgi:hypothetical protein
VALIIDHGNTWQTLPLPCESIEWSLEGKAKAPKPRKELDENNEVVEKPAVERSTLAQGDRRQLKELSIESIYEQRVQKRVKAVKKNLYLVEAKNFSPAILWPWAKNPEGLTADQCRRVERALGLPMGYCNVAPIV